jgi:hypothetical protein
MFCLLLVWLSGGINLDELNLSFGLKEKNAIMGHVMPLTTVATGQSILSVAMMVEERATLILKLGDKIPTIIAEPVVKMEYAMVGLVVLGICVTAIPHGIWWDSYGAYASSLFLIYIIAFQSVALSLEWHNSQMVNSINIRYLIQNDEIKRSAMEWLQNLKTVLDARFENAQDYHIELQREPEKLWLIRFLMQWAFDIELIVEDAQHISKLSGDWSSSEEFKKAFASNLDQDHTCLHDFNDKLDRITTLMTKEGLTFNSGYMNLLAWATHVPFDTLQEEHHNGCPRLASCKCRDKPLCIYIKRTNGVQVYISSMNFVQPQLPGKWTHIWLLLCSFVAIANLLYCYPIIFAVLQLSVPIYKLEFVNFPNIGNVYGCLNCFHDGAYFRNGTLLSHQQIIKFPLNIGDKISIAFGVVVVCMSLLGTAIIVTPAVSSRLFKHYDCKNHRWFRWCVKLLANSFRYDKCYMALIFITLGGACAFSSGFKIIPPTNVGFIGWTSTTSYTYALLLTGMTAAFRHMVLSGARI